MTQDDTENRSRKALADILNKQAQTNDVLLQENESLTQNQRKLLTLLQTKDSKLEKYKQKLAKIDKSGISTVLANALKSVFASRLRHSLLKIIDSIKYKEKAFYQIQYYQLKTFSRNFIFMVKLNQLFKRKHLYQLNLAYYSIQSTASKDLQQAIQIKQSMGITKLCTQLQRRYQLSFNAVQLYARLSYNPFKTLLNLTTRKERLKRKSMVQPRIRKKNRNPFIARHKLQRATIFCHKQKLTQLGQHYKDGMCVMLNKSNEMKQAFDKAIKEQQLETQQLQRQLMEKDEVNKAQITHLQTTIGQLKSELSTQVSQTVEVEMNLHVKEKECNQLKQELQRQGSQINSLRHEMNVLSDQKSKTQLTAEQTSQEKYETAQKLEESYMTLKHLKREYDQLKNGYGSLEHHNRDLIADNQHKHQQIYDTKINAYMSKLEEYEVNVELLHVQLNHHMQQSRISVQDAVSDSTTSRLSSNRSIKKTHQLEEQLAKVKAQNIELTKEAIQLNEEKLQIKDLMDSHEKQIHQLTQQKLNLEAKMKHMLQVFEETQVIKAKDQNLGQKLVKAEQENTSLVARVQHLECTIESIKKQFYVQLQQTNKEKDDLSNQIQQLSKRLQHNEAQGNQEQQELANALGDLNREKVNLMRELTLEHEARLKVEKDCMSLQEQLEKHRTELISYQEQLELYVKVIKQLDSKVKKQ